MVSNGHLIPMEKGKTPGTLRRDLQTLTKSRQARVLAEDVYAIRPLPPGCADGLVRTAPGNKTLGSLGK